MKLLVVLIPLIVLLSASSPFKNSFAQECTRAKAIPFINQFFLFAETLEPQSCISHPDISSVVFGAIYLTKNGNIIFASVNEKEERDTVSYFWGKYTLTNSKISYTLTDEYYFQGKWDEYMPDYSKINARAKTRKIRPIEITLSRTKCDSVTFFRSYSKEEMINSAKWYNEPNPKGVIYWRYYETKDMKFYTWIFKQIPVLANL